MILSDRVQATTSSTFLHQHPGSIKFSLLRQQDHGTRYQLPTKAKDDKVEVAIGAPQQIKVVEVSMVLPRIAEETEGASYNQGVTV